MGVVLFVLFGVLVLFEHRTVEVVNRADPACPGCGYCLGGLPPRGLCPECGGQYFPEPASRPVDRLGLRAGVLPFLIVALATVIVYEATGIGRWLYAQGVIQSYLDAGYRPEVAVNAAFKRELARGGADGVQALGGSWLGVSPMLALMPPGGPRYAVLFGIEAALLILIWVSGPGY